MYDLYVVYTAYMHKMKVQVTQPLIDRATSRDSRHCMIAEAITAAHPHLKSVIVDLATIRWSNPKTGKRYIALTPEIAASRLVDFDQGNPVEPFSFNLAALQVTEMTRAKESRGQARADGRTQPRSRRPSSTRKLEMIGGQPVIVGGYTLPTGHLSNKPPSGAVAEKMDMKDAKATPAPSEAASNVTRSSRRYRQYGRRLLKS